MCPKIKIQLSVLFRSFKETLRFANAEPINLGKSLPPIRKPARLP